VVATFDDPNKQWIYSSIQEQGILCPVTLEIDLTIAPQTIILLPPINFKEAPIGFPSIELTQRNGTIAGSATMKMGSNSTFDNLVPATAQASLNAAAVGYTGLLNGVNASIANGIEVLVTAGATLGTATVFKAKVYWLIAITAS
jgi:hypothetical protein